MSKPATGTWPFRAVAEPELAAAPVHDDVTILGPGLDEIGDNSPRSLVQGDVARRRHGGHADGAREHRPVP